MLRYSFKLEEAAKTIENAVSQVLAAGYLTGDLMASGTAKHEVQSTSAMGDLIAAKVKEL
jgi:3-isopropylmalate dehydrogenase